MYNKKSLEDHTASTGSEVNNQILPAAVDVLARDCSGSLRARQSALILSCKSSRQVEREDHGRGPGPTWRMPGGACPEPASQDQSLGVVRLCWNSGQLEQWSSYLGADQSGHASR